MALSRYCEECLKFTQGGCEGKDLAKIMRWGKQLVSPSGLKFCSRYELDGSLCGGSNNENEVVETFKDIRERQEKKTEEDSNQEIADDVDFGENLSSSDFEDLPV